MAHNKVFKWFGKNEKDEKEQEDYYMRTTDGRPYKIQWQKPHETEDRGLWKNNTLGRNFQSAIKNRKNFNADLNDNGKRHQSLPVPPKTPVGEKPRQRDFFVDSRRFGMIDPFDKNLNMDNNFSLDSYFAQELQKDEERKKLRESLNINDNNNNNKNNNNNNDNNNNDNRNSIPKIDVNKVPVRPRRESRRESQQSLSRDSRVSYQDTRQSLMQDNKALYQESQQWDSRTSHRESQQRDSKTLSQQWDSKTLSQQRDSKTLSQQRDSRASHRESQQSIRDTKALRRESNVNKELPLTPYKGKEVEVILKSKNNTSIKSNNNVNNNSNYNNYYNVVNNNNVVNSNDVNSNVVVNNNNVVNSNVVKNNNVIKNNVVNNNNDNVNNSDKPERPPLPKKSSSRFKERKIPGTCSRCRGKMAEGGYRTQWCHTCEGRKFESKFGTWTSGNDVIDTFILESQLSAKSRFDYLEWIPFDRFKDVQLIGSGGLGSVYQAIWLDGPREKWDKKSRQYVRCGEWRIALRSLDNSENITLGFFDELKAHLHCENNSGNYVTRCYGMTQNTKTKDYMIVVQYARNGDLWKYMNKNSVGITWKRKLDILYGIATGLYRIHGENIIHRNLHSGNILINSYMTLISDLGLWCRADNFHVKDEAFGVLPYVAPELLRGQPCTTAVDVYSFGTIMWEMAFGRKPFGNRAHDLELATDIVNGLQPEIIDELPECYLKLMRNCWNLDPFKRPSSEKLYVTLGDWLCKVYNVSDSDVSIQFSDAERRRLESIKQDSKYFTPDQVESPIESPTYPISEFYNSGENIHPKAIFKSRLLRFKSLKEPPPIITFTRTRKVCEHLAIQEYIAAETNKYNVKYEMMQADNTEIGAEVYEILQYW